MKRTTEGDSEGALGDLDAPLACRWSCSRGALSISTGVKTVSAQTLLWHVYQLCESKTLFELKIALHMRPLVQISLPSHTPSYSPRSLLLPSLLVRSGSAGFANRKAILALLGRLPILAPTSGPKLVPFKAKGLTGSKNSLDLHQFPGTELGKTVGTT